MAYIIFIALLILIWYFNESLYNFFFNNKKIIKPFSVVCCIIGGLMFFPFLYIKDTSPTWLVAGLVLFMIGVIPLIMYWKIEEEEGE